MEEVETEPSVCVVVLLSLLLLVVVVSESEYVGTLSCRFVV